MFVIGLTGGIGSGKSTVAELFAKKGVTVIDTDQLARDVMLSNQPAYDAIIHRFGTADRGELRKIVFANPDDRIWLEELLHPLIRRELKRQAETAQSPYCIAVIPLLFESTPNPLIQRVLVVDTTEELQLQRGMLRDNQSQSDIEAILKTQVSRETRLSKADDIIPNNGTPLDLIPHVDQLHQKYLAYANKIGSA